MINYSIMSPEDLVRWFEPKTENEKILHKALTTIAENNLIVVRDLQGSLNDVMKIERDNDKLMDGIEDLEKQLRDKTQDHNQLVSEISQFFQRLNKENMI